MSASEIRDEGRPDRRPHLPHLHLHPGPRAGRVHLQPVPRRRRGAAALPHRDAAAVPARARGGRARHAGGPAAVDRLRPPGGRRVRLGERVPRGRPARAGRPRRARLHAVARTTSSSGRRARSQDGDVLDIGGASLARRVVEIATPHVPHNWESHMFFEQESGTLFLGDLLTQVGDGPAVRTDDLVEDAIVAEDLFHQTSLGPLVPQTYRRLADLAPKRLAIMHGSSYEGDAATLLRTMADVYEERYGCGPAAVPAQPLPGARRAGHGLGVSGADHDGRGAGSRAGAGARPRRRDAAGGDGVRAPRRRRAGARRRGLAPSRRPTSGGTSATCSATCSA